MDQENWIQISLFIYNGFPLTHIVMSRARTSHKGHESYFHLRTLIYRILSFYEGETKVKAPRLKRVWAGVKTRDGDSGKSLLGTGHIFYNQIVNGI